MPEYHTFGLEVVRISGGSTFYRTAILTFNTGGINMEHEILDVILKTSGTLASSAVRGVLFRIFRHVILNQPDHVIERVFNSFSSAQEYNDKKLQCGETLRGDWYYDNHNDVKFAEDMVRQTISDTQGKKSEYITKFHVNIRFSSNDDIDEHTAFSYLEAIESLSWRQLCIIRLIALNDNEKIDRHSNISDEKVENLSDHQRMAFHAIGREYQELMDNHYIDGTAMSHVWSQDKWNREPWLDSPELWGMPNYTKRLHDLMDLNEISDREITETFSIWGVKLKKS